jgi:hypothetical protein
MTSRRDCDEVPDAGPFVWTFWDKVGLGFMALFFSTLGVFGFLEVWFDYQPPWAQICFMGPDECDAYDDGVNSIYTLWGGFIFPLALVLGLVGLIVWRVEKVKEARKK